MVRLFLIIFSVTIPPFRCFPPCLPVCLPPILAVFNPPLCLSRFLFFFPVIEPIFWSFPPGFMTIPPHLGVYLPFPHSTVVRVFPTVLFLPFPNLKGHPPPQRFTKRPNRKPPPLIFPLVTQYFFPLSMPYFIRRLPLHPYPFLPCFPPFDFFFPGERSTLPLFKAVLDCNGTNFECFSEQILPFLPSC